MSAGARVSAGELGPGGGRGDGRRAAAISHRPYGPVEARHGLPLGHLRRQRGGLVRPRSDHWGGERGRRIVATAAAARHRTVRGTDDVLDVLLRDAAAGPAGGAVLRGGECGGQYG